MDLRLQFPGRATGGDRSLNISDRFPSRFGFPEALNPMGRTGPVRICSESRCAESEAGALQPEFDGVDRRLYNA